VKNAKKDGGRQLHPSARTEKGRKNSVVAKKPCPRTSSRQGKTKSGRQENQWKGDFDNRLIRTVKGVSCKGNDGRRTSLSRGKTRSVPPRRATGLQGNSKKEDFTNAIDRKVKLYQFKDEVYHISQLGGGTGNLLAKKKGVDCEKGLQMGRLGSETSKNEQGKEHHNTITGGALCTG